jgi:hypothetical protein
MAGEDLQGISNQLQAAYNQGLAAYNAKNPGAAAANAAAAKAAADKLLTDYHIYTDKQGNTYVTGAGTSLPYVFIPPKPGGKLTPTTDINAARNQVLAAVGPKGLPNLLTKLYTSGFITKTELKSQNYIGGLNAAINQYSVNALQEYQLNKGAGTFPTMDTFLKKFTVGSIGGATNLAGTKTAIQDFTTTRGRADADLTLYYMENFGQAPTQAEKDDYFTQVVKAEKTNTTKTVTTTDTVGAIKNQTTADSRLGAADYLVLQANVAKKKFPSLDATGILSVDNKTPGKLASDINLALKYASDYGLKITPQQALGYVGDSWGTANPLDAVKTRMQQLAISTMPNLASHIQAGGTVKDVADVYGAIKSRKLGITIPDSTADNQIMSSINLKGGMLNMADFERQLQADPQWRKTAEAHQAATDFTNTILQSFGFGGN